MLGFVSEQSRRVEEGLGQGPDSHREGKAEFGLTETALFTCFVFILN